MVDYKKLTIEEDFGGDVDKYNKYIDKTRNETLSWQEIENNAQVLPEMSARAKATIRVMLGYLPHPERLLRFEPSIRAISYMERMGTIKSSEEFYDAVEPHVKIIRNLDVAPLAVRDADERKIKYYYDTFQPFGQIVRDRLTYLVGYEPKLEHSLELELNMRDHIKADLSLHVGKPGEQDFKAIVALKYLEIFIDEGLEAANNSDLLGGAIRKYFEEEEPVLAT